MYERSNETCFLDGFCWVISWTIRIIVVDAFNEAFDDGILADTQRKAVISLIYKKGDAELLANYRPISLTNVEYKILAFCLATRMQPMKTQK